MENGAPFWVKMEYRQDLTAEIFLEPFFTFL